MATQRILPMHTEAEDIYAAARKGNLAAVESFLKEGVDINARDSSSKGTALIYAATEGREEIVSFLIGKEADLNCQNEFGHTALAMAACWGHQESVRLLLEAGANLEPRNQHDQTAYELALEKKEFAIAKMLKEAPEERLQAIAQKAASEEAEKRNLISEKQNLLKEKMRNKPGLKPRF
jgi:ankyrin repeat protein